MTIEMATHVISVCICIQTMWLQRLVPVIDKYLSHYQAGFRVNSGVKEQLSAVLEVMETTDGTDRISRATDAPSAVHYQESRHAEHHWMAVTQSVGRKRLAE